MILTNALARKNIGKYIDCLNRQSNHCGEYPREIIKFPDGTLGTKRLASGVCTRIVDSGFNVQYFDYMFENIQEYFIRENELNEVQE